MRTVLSWVAFATAVYTFSGLWGAFRSAWEGTPATPPAAFLGLTAAFLLSLGYVAFVIYAAERAAGRVRRPIAFFDRLLGRLRHG
jgi:hypothetical protein